MTLAVSILAALLLISLVLLADQWIRKQALIAYLSKGRSAYADLLTVLRMI